MYDNPDDWFNCSKRKTHKSKGAGGGGTKPTNRSIGNRKAQTLKTIKSINSKAPQVVIKMSGSSKGADKAQAHTNYIGRNGEVEIENETGQKFVGEEQRKLLKSWEAMGMPSKDKEGTRREAFHFVFSMPNGTDPTGLKNAVRNLVNEEFQGHNYFLAQHLDTDSPHCHVLVCATDDRGARLNPRKADFQNYRIKFVEKLEEQGIEATTSRRIHRFKYKEGKTQESIHKSLREGIKPNSDLTPSSKKKIQDTHLSVEEKYKNYANNESNLVLKKQINNLIKGSKNIER